MAYIAVFPKSTDVQNHLTDNSSTIMTVLTEATKKILGVPDYDIIVELNQCTAIGFNAQAVKKDAVPDVVIKIATSDRDLQPRFQSLCDEIISQWDIQTGKALKLELWINLIDTWGCNIDFSS